MPFNPFPPPQLFKNICSINCTAKYFRYLNPKLLVHVEYICCKYMYTPCFLILYYFKFQYMLIHRFRHTLSKQNSTCSFLISTQYTYTHIVIYIVHLHTYIQYTYTRTYSFQYTVHLHKNIQSTLTHVHIVFSTEYTYTRIYSTLTHSH